MMKMWNGEVKGREVPGYSREKEGGIRRFYDEKRRWLPGRPPRQRP
jgi:hypothetical protein